MPRKSPGAKVKGLGTELRILREKAGLKQSDAARALGLSVQVISRLESGQRNISIEEVVALLAIYQVTGPRRELLLTMARTLDDPGWWEQEVPGLTQESATLASYEETARKISNWAPALVPGLLQTMSYTRAYMLDDGIPPAEVEHRLTTRLRRQHRITRPDVEYTALIGEAALRGADRLILIEQLVALLAVMARPNTTVRIVPMDRMRHAGRLGGFIALEPADGMEPVVNVELLRGAVFLDEEPLTCAYFQTLARLTKVALTEAESERWIYHRKAELES